MVPITRSTQARCQGDRGAESTCLMPIAFTCVTKSAPKIRSAIAQQIARRSLPRESLSQLLGSPLSRRMSGDAKVQNAPPVVRQHQEHVQDLEPYRRHRKKVDGNHSLHVVVQEGPPSLGGRVPAPDHILAHARLADVDAQLE